MKYHKPEISELASAIHAVQNPEASKAFPRYQDNIEGEPVSYGTAAAYAADE
jgi:hypothetical protein